MKGAGNSIRFLINQWEINLVPLTILKTMKWILVNVVLYITIVKLDRIGGPEQYKANFSVTLIYFNVIFFKSKSDYVVGVAIF